MDPGLRLDDLAERPERDAVAVREAAAVAPGDDLLVVRDGLPELGDEPALADSRHADERHELRRAIDADARERTEQERALVVATDERRGRLVAPGPPTRPRASTASHTSTGSDFPFASTGACGR